jgi:glutathione peroxidase
MKRIVLLSLFTFCLPFLSWSESLYDISVTRINGQTEKMSAYEGKVLLIVNTASQCGFTPQYKTLQALYEKYHAQGFEVLAFPCNDFGGQEPGSESDIADFVQDYKVTFPMFEKVSIKGKDAHPLYQFLLAQTFARESAKVKWNFSKFLIDRQGQVVKQYASDVDPMASVIQQEIQRLLALGGPKEGKKS